MTRRCGVAIRDEPRDEPSEVVDACSEREISQGNSIDSSLLDVSLSPCSLLEHYTS